MLATDPLSLVFLGCALFSGVFLLISSLLGAGQQHGAHAGHAGHLGHIAHGGAGSGHAAPAGHGAHAATDLHAAHTSHTSHNVSHHAAAQAEQAPAIWGTVNSLVLGALNVYGLLMFLLVFGLVGYVLHGILGWNALALLAAGALGFTVAVLVSALFARLFATPAGTILTAEEARMQGRIGTISMEVRPGGIGEVIFSRAEGGRQSIGARSGSGERLPAGTEVVILDYHDGVATVETWDSFVTSARKGTLPPLPGAGAH